LIAVDPAYTSQTCHECGHVDKANRTSQSTFTCVACGHTDHADVNAARNILARARALADLEHAASVQTKKEGPDMARIACGEDISRARPASAKHAASMKQEPAERLACA
jgi:putative transposase